MNNLELLQLMTDSAKDAVNTSKQEFDVELDYSEQSVSKVDDLLLSFLDRFQAQVLEDKAIFTLCNMYGAYVGETFRGIAGGNWLFDETNPQAPSIFLAIGEQTYAFAGICYERLVNNSETSVKDYFDQALKAHRPQ
jgi:hypothetical protein